MEKDNMIETERIVLVPFERKYLPDYFHGFNAEITKYQWPDPYESIEDAEEMLKGFLEEMERGETLFLSILSRDGQFLGSAELHGLQDKCPEAGIWIVQAEQKKGYAYEALRALLRYAETKYGHTEFFYEADRRNAGSMKLLRKLAKDYDVMKQGSEDIATDSGKRLLLESHILKAK